MLEEGGPTGRRNSPGQGAVWRASVGGLRTSSGQPKRRSRRGWRRRGRQQPRTVRDAKQPAKEQTEDWRRGLWGRPGVAGGVPWEPGKGASEGRGRRGGSLEQLRPPPAPPHPRLSPLSSGSRHECPPPPHTRASSAAPPRPQRPRPSQTFLVTPPSPPPSPLPPQPEVLAAKRRVLSMPFPAPIPGPRPLRPPPRTHALPQDELCSARHPDASDRCCRRRRHHRHRGTELVQAPGPLP